MKIYLKCPENVGVNPHRFSYENTHYKSRYKVMQGLRVFIVM